MSSVAIRYVGASLLTVVLSVSRSEEHTLNSSHDVISRMPSSA